ncbi:MAG: site-2 protease family protein [Patescibacteria group bacterium]|nr:site-2 protease family protein [Patescibacteria group bacterium]
MILTILIFLILLSVLVIAHEFGHFFVAKKMGMDVEEFGLGFPPRVFAWKGKKGMLWSLNLIPIGGFVRIKGESGDNRNDPKSFATKSIPARIIVILAGVVMNMILAGVFLSIGFGFGFPGVVDDSISPKAHVSDQHIVISHVLEGSPAAENIELGDVLISINGVPYINAAVSHEAISKLAEEDSMFITVERSGEEETFEISAVFLEEINKDGIGISLVDVGIVRYPWYMAPWKGIQATASFTWQILAMFGFIIKELFTQGGASIDISGPVGIAVFTGEVARQGFLYLLQFAAILSINLAIINVLPFPALDGGRLVFLLAEGIRKKPVNAKVEAIIHNFGFLLLMLLVVVITYKDIVKFF